MSKAQAILRAIQERQQQEAWKQRVLGIKEPNYKEFEIEHRPPSADD